MSIQRICTYIFILIISIPALFSSSSASAQDFDDDDTTSVAKPKKQDLAGHQLSIGVDIYRPVMNYFIPNKYAYEAEVNYYLRKEFYAAAHAGWGGTKVDYPDLKYNCTNTFMRLGFYKSVLARSGPTDWDMFFFGLGSGAAFVSRGAASFSVTDSTWGSITGSEPGRTFGAVWAEITGGVRVELIKGLMVGWNVREKFMLNNKSFRDLAPLYIAGFGRGDKNSSFDLNAYVCYAIRWNRKAKEKKDAVLPLPVAPSADSTKAATTVPKEISK